MVGATGPAATRVAGAVVAAAGVGDGVSTLEQLTSETLVSRIIDQRQSGARKKVESDMGKQGSG